MLTDAVYNHVLRLDLDTFTWNLIDNYGDIPCVRMGNSSWNWWVTAVNWMLTGLGHTTIYWKDNTLITFGGENDVRLHLDDVYFFDIPTATWTRPSIKGTPPQGRSRHAVCLHDDKMFIVGGITAGLKGSHCLDTMCYLDLKTMTWSKEWNFVARFDHSCWVHNGKLWVYGGLQPGMERGGGLCWLDLRESSAFSGASILAESSSNWVSPPNPYSHASHLSVSSTSNSLRNSPAPNLRRHRAPPGTTGAIKFNSGPHVPPESKGTHFYHLTSDTLLDFLTPINTTRSSDVSISALDIDTLQWRTLARGNDTFAGAGYRWYYLTVSPQSSMAYLIGSPLEPPEGATEAENLSVVLPIDLSFFGVHRTPPTDVPPPLGFLGGDLSSIFDVPSSSITTATGIAPDFKIYGLRDEVCEGDEHDLDGPWANTASLAPSSTRDSTSSTPGTLSPTTNLPPLTVRSPPIHAHKLILSARWPHFRSILSSRMSEYHTSTLYIPEPYTVIHAFLSYLYSDSISTHPLNIVAGLLVLANLYDLPRLRQLAMGRILKELEGNIEHAATIWERVGTAGEEALRKKVGGFCLDNWGRLVRTKGFRGLGKSALLELCEEGGVEGRVVRQWGGGGYDRDGDQEDWGEEGSVMDYEEDGMEVEEEEEIEEEDDGGNGF